MVEDGRWRQALATKPGLAGLGSKSRTTASLRRLHGLDTVRDIGILSNITRGTTISTSQWNSDIPWASALRWPTTPTTRSRRGIPQRRCAVCAKRGRQSGDPRLLSGPNVELGFVQIIPPARNRSMSRRESRDASSALAALPFAVPALRSHSRCASANRERAAMDCAPSGAASRSAPERAQ